MTIEDEVDRLIDTRPGKELLAHIYDEAAVEVFPGIFRSAGASAAYAVRHGAGRMIVNTGMGYEAVHHKRLFDAAVPGPTTHILSTQAHVDHVGGVGHFREPAALYIAQANNRACQADDARIQRLRFLTAQIWFDVTGTNARRIAAENPGVPMRQDTPTPDLTFDRRLAFTVGGLDVELIAAPGETLDSMIVWLPQHRVAMISNLLGPLFPHFPNFNTLRGDRYRFVEPYLATVRTLRELQPEVLIPGRHLPIEGSALIDASLARLHGAVEYVHRETLAGMNAGVDIDTLVRSISLPGELRVGQGYGKVAWGVRTIWETYMGWFTLRSTTELYPGRAVDAFASLVPLAGADAVLDQARSFLADGRPVDAIHLAEAVIAAAGTPPAAPSPTAPSPTAPSPTAPSPTAPSPTAPSPTAAQAAAIIVAAHDALLTQGGDESFWESGWLRHQRTRWSNWLPSSTPPQTPPSPNSTLPKPG